MYREFEDGQKAGILVPLVDVFQKEFKLKVELVKLNWSEAFKQLESGELDFYGLAGLDSEQRKKFPKTGPLYREKGAIVSRTDAPVRSLIYLKGKKVGILYGSMLEGTIMNYVDSQDMLVRFYELESMLDALEHGEIDCLITIGSTKIEVMRRPNLQFEFSVQDYFVDQGILCGREELIPLVDRINQYMQTPKGKAIVSSLPGVNKKAILKNHKRLLAEEIDHVRRKFPVVKMYDTAIFYPLCYKEHDEFKGMVPEINRVFTELTGVKVQIGDHGCGKDGITAALKKIRNGQCHLSLGGYANTAPFREDGLEFSQSLWTDVVRFYSYGHDRSELGLSQARIGVTPNLEHYFAWNMICKTPPIVYHSRIELIDALKKRKIDAITIGTMSLNYQNVILKDFRFQELDAPSAQAEMHLIYGTQNPELNLLFDESIRLYQVLFPESSEHWRKVAEQANIDYIRHRKQSYDRLFIFFLILAALIVMIFLILYRFIKYDKQIRRLIQTQQTLDIAWVDLRKRQLISKGDHPFFRRWGFPFSGPVCSFDEINRLFGVNIDEKYRQGLNNLKEQGTNFTIMDEQLVSPKNGETMFYRRYLHRLNDNQFMMCMQDMNAQHESEQQEQFLIELFGAFKSGLLFIDKNMKVLRYNRAMADLFPLYDSSQTTCYSCFRGREEPCENCAIQKTFCDGKKHSQVEFFEISKRWVELTSYPVRNAQTGEVDRVLEFVQDITEQHDREAELEHRKEFLNAILNASNDGIIAISDDDGGTHENSRLIEMFDGYGAAFFSNDTPDIRDLHKSLTVNPEEIYEARDRNRETQEPQRGTLYFHDGRIYQWRLASVQTGIGQTGYTRIWTFRDATEEYRAAERIRESEQRFRTLFNQMPNGLALYNVQRDENGNPTRFTYSQVNSALEGINHCSSEQIYGKTIREALPDIQRISEDFEPIPTDEHWILILGTAAMQGQPQSCLVARQNGTYQRLNIFKSGPEQLGIFVTEVTPLISTAKALRESEHRVSSLFASMTNGIVLLNVIRDETGQPVDFQVTTANPAYCDLLKVTFEALTSQTFLKVFENYHIETQGFPDCWWGGMRLASEGISGTYHCWIPDIVSAPYQEFVIFPVGKDKIGMLMYDETYRIRSEKQLKLMQFIIDSISQPVFWLYLEGTIQYANDAAAIAWGFEKTEIFPNGPIGDKVWSYDMSVSPENWPCFVEALKDVNSQRFDTTMRHVDGTIFPAVVTANLLERDGKPFLTACFQDLTDQTERIKAEQKAIAKSSFLDHMTHEIRTPLNGVIGITDLLLKTEVDQQQKNYLEMAKLSGQQLLSIVNNILDYSTIEDDKLILKEFEFDLWAFIAQFRKLAFSILAERTSDIKPEFIVLSEVPQFIIGDEIRLRQVVFNLLDNALKFTHQGHITVTVSVTHTMPEPTYETEERKQARKHTNVTTGSFLKISVEDSGIGISKDMIGDLFDAFMMADASFSRKYGGTGLGLPISRGLVHKMGGEVYIESELGVGSTFEFIVPLKLSPRAKQLSNSTLPLFGGDENSNESMMDTTILKAPTPLELEQMETKTTSFSPDQFTILVVEDNRINRIVTGEILKRVGYHHEFAENGLQACRAIANKKFDFVLMDCQMPVMDGFEATRRIRKMEHGQDELRPAHSGHIPIVALTANALTGDEQKCLESGMDGFCSKPIDSENLLKVIKHWIENAPHHSRE